ncbi:hypothetical protein D1610_11500 [Sphingomonas gilva]|uniref:Uncharacterized protein n=1 Tax=Sphingomonas gilva TaxID=2305907 RepID=A0A396RLF4_9SPHN|nr:hypothetical protein [Sphingomonas gilva]RHW17167.1 hypothetical protein D1610_11500 [Sphingomonas gilva]
MHDEDIAMDVAVAAAVAVAKASGGTFVGCSASQGDDGRWEAKFSVAVGSRRRPQILHGRLS